MDNDALLDIAAKLSDLGYQIEAYPADVDVAALIKQLREIIAELETPEIAGDSLTRWEQWFAFMHTDADGNDFRGGFVNMNRDDGWSLTTTHANHVRSLDPNFPSSETV